MTNINYFKTPGGVKKFQEDSGIASDVSQLSIRQVIKRKNRANQALKDYKILFSTWKKRLAYQRYMRATIQLCDQIQKERRSKAVDYYYSLPQHERTSKNWIKYTSLFSHSGKCHKQFLSENIEEQINGNQ